MAFTWWTLKTSLGEPEWKSLSETVVHATTPSCCRAWMRVTRETWREGWGWNRRQCPVLSGMLGSPRGSEDLDASEPRTASMNPGHCPSTREEVTGRAWLSGDLRVDRPVGRPSRLRGPRTVCSAGSSRVSSRWLRERQSRENKVVLSPLSPGN